MHDINKQILVGNLSRDPIITPDGKAQFEIVTSRRIDGIEEKHFQTVIASGSKAVFCMNYLKKGDRVYVEGPIRKRRVVLPENAENYDHRNKEITLWSLEVSDIAPASQLEKRNEFDPLSQNPFPPQEELPNVLKAPTTSDDALKLTSDFSDLY